MSKFMNLLDNIHAVNTAMEALKEKLVAYYADNSESLDVRWAAFCNAPTPTKEHYSYTVHFPSEVLLDANEICWMDDFDYAKHETVNMVDVVRHFEYTWDEDIFEDKFGCEKVKFLNSLRSDILMKNIGTFVVNW